MIFFCNIVITLCAFICAKCFQNGITWHFGVSEILGYLSVPVLTLVVMYFYRFYDRYIYVERVKLFYRLIQFAFTLLGLYLFIGFLTDYFLWPAGRTFIVMYFMVLTCLMILMHLVVIPSILCSQFSNPAKKIPCIFLGDPNDRRKFDEFVDSYPVLGLTPVYGKDTGEISGKPEIFIVSESTDYGSLYNEISRHLTNGSVPIHVASGLFDQLRLKWDWIRYNGIPVLTFRRVNNDAVRGFVRRIFDFLFSLLFLILLSPLFLLIGLAIKIDSRGPVFFKQKRCTGNGRTFTCYKFRTMLDGNDKDCDREGAYYEYLQHKTTAGKILNKNEVTPIGSLLRKTSLDEFPQLLNVFLGEMSIVGPRPAIHYEVKHYQPWQRDRLLVKPGLTGVWQVYGRGCLPADHSMFLDLIYVMNRSLTLDIKLILRTVPGVLFGRGAY